MKLTLKALPLALLCASLVCGAALAQVQPSPRGRVHSRFGLPMSRPQAQPADTANRQEASPDLPDLSLTFGIFTYPGSVGSFAAGVTKSGHMVGGYGPNNNVNSPSNDGFLLNGTKFTTLDYPGAVFTQPNGINDAGVIVGVWGTSLYSVDIHGFKLAGKSYTSFDYPGATEGTTAIGINKSGDIVGDWSDNTTTEHGFLLSKGVFTSIDVPGAYYTIAWGINNSGEIAGWYGLTASDSHGFIYSKGTFTTFDYPGGYSQNYVADINDSGVIIGGYGDTTTINGVVYSWEHCYVYESGQFTSCDPPFGPPAATQAWHLNDYGVITGFYVDNSSTSYGYEALIGP
jgi:hypothetical protein